MDALKTGDIVELVSDPSLGRGAVRFVDEVAGRSNVGVRWATGSIVEYTPGQLRRIVALPDRLRDVGAASTAPFQLKVLGRWFEARHELTGELSNQPFDMLPHQVVVTHRIMTSPPAPDGGRHWLIADDVGLGKTIEAGMVLEVMRKRAGGSLRCLIVAPAGLVGQWQVELAEKFGRVFLKFDRDPNVLQQHDQVIASIDTLRLRLKPEKGKGAALDVHPWDLVIFDEAHHVTKPGVLKYELAKFLRENGKARNLLFLTATPYSGNHEHFCHMLHLLRSDRVAKPTGKLKVLPELPLAEMVIRNRKSLVTDARGNRIFHGIGKTMILPFRPTKGEEALGNEVREYLRTGYDAAGRMDGKTAAAVGFLMATTGKIASSSRDALRAFLRTRRDILGGTSDVDPGADDETASEDVEREAGKAVGPGKAGKRKTSPIEGELKRVEELLAHLELLPGRDSKLEGFVAQVRPLVEKDPTLKLLVFTEYRATQTCLQAALQESFGDESVGVINGSMPMDARRAVVDRFNTKDNPRFVVSTAAGGEGLNLQHRCYTVVNYDLPWNPSVLQQRIGRVYRYGQKRPVVVYNLKVETESDAFADSRVYEYLDRKLRDIAESLATVQGEGAEDLLGDVLGQAAVAGLSLDELHRQAVEEGAKKVIEGIDEKAKHLETILKDPDILGIFAGIPRFNIDDYRKVEARVTTEQLRFFVEQYCRHAEAPSRHADGGFFSFTPSKTLVEIAEKNQKRDPYAAPAPRDAIHQVVDATVDKVAAQEHAGNRTPRLLRFGDPIFEAMVSHAQYSDFSTGVASLDIPAARLGWSAGQQGTWLLFELSIFRTEGDKRNVLQRELLSLLVPQGSEIIHNAPGGAAGHALIEQLTEATDGPGDVDVAEARRAHSVGLVEAKAYLTRLLEGVQRTHRGDVSIAAAPVVDFALAWVRAS